MVPSDKRIFTREELRRYDGRQGVVFVAFRGKVYDVSRSFQWKRGIHQVIHRAGQDLTGEIERAPHGANMLEKFPIVGELPDTE